MNTPTKRRAQMRAKIKANKSNPPCGATASAGVLVCILESGHEARKPHATSTNTKASQFATWTVEGDKVLVKSFSHGKLMGEWTEEGAKDERAPAQPCGCSGVRDVHALGTPIVCSVQPHHACVCRGTAFRLHLDDMKGCENPTTNPHHKRAWFTDADGLVARIEEEDDRPEWLIKQTADRDAAGRKPMTAEQKLVDPHSGGVLLEDLLAEREAKKKGRAPEQPEPDEAELAATDSAMEAASEDTLDGPESDDADELDESVRSDEERDFARKLRQEREAHAEMIDRDIKPENMIAPTGETITCGGRVYPVHPLARIFPTPEKQYRETLESIRVNGLLHDIELLDEPGNAVIDGCTRLRACEELGITPRTKLVHVDDKRAYVKAANLDRRHLDASLRAVAAADLATLEHGANQHTRGPTDRPVLTQAQAAEMMGVSEQSVRRAVRVRNKGTPELQAAVREGRIKVDAAIDLVELEPAKQRELLERVTKGKGEVRAGKVRSLVRQEQKREVVSRINRDLVRPMPIGPFGLIVVDYPWKFENSDQHEGSRGHLPYPPMTMPEIHAHAVEATKRAADDCVLGLWVTNAHLFEAKAVIDTWGFTYQSPITWDKVHVGMGISGPRGQTEHLILAYRGKPKHTLNELTTLIRTPREPGHSKKPDLFYDLLAKHCAGPRLELFAIGDREAWETWGAEAEKPISTERKPKRSKILTSTDERLRAS